MYQVTKTFGYDTGLSCAFRQWRAKSHCNKLHGYALGITFTLEAINLDDRNWVADFGDFKYIKQRIQETFDHKTVVAIDDPQMPIFEVATSLGIIDLVILPNVGCEMFAEYIFGIINHWLVSNNDLSGRVRLVSVTVSEHGANSATFIGDKHENTKAKVDATPTSAIAPAVTYSGSSDNNDGVVHSEVRVTESP
jgi:6-pyruvoyltetrahydropterin/6-carboxytetrahydropterin synthase